MTPYQNNHHRRSIRLKGFDYTQPGAYFITLVTQDRINLFGEIANGEMQCNRFGNIVLKEWRRLPKRFPSISLGAMAIMPNHFHCIIIIHDRTGTAANRTGTAANRTGTAAECRGTAENPNDLDPLESSRAPTTAPTTRESFGKPVPGSIPTIIRSFKSSITLDINRLRNAPGAPVWQRNYYEHVIRDESEWNRIHSYIQDNPSQWDRDRNRPGK